MRWENVRNTLNQGKAFLGATAWQQVSARGRGVRASACGQECGAKREKTNSSSVKTCGISLARGGGLVAA